LWAPRRVHSTVSSREEIVLSDLLTRNVLVMSQKPKFIEMMNEYEIGGEDGTLVGFDPAGRAVESAQDPSPGL
jgi:hypothetical protein